MTNEPSKHAVEAAEQICPMVQQSSYAEPQAAVIIQSSNDAATVELLEKHERDIDERNNALSASHYCHDKEKKRAEAAEQQVLVLREVVESFKMLIVPCGLDNEWPEGQGICDAALSTSAEIASGYVPVADVKPLLEAMERSYDATDFLVAGSTGTTRARAVFLARHGDKFK